MTPDTQINDELSAWDRDSLLHPSTHTAGHVRGETPQRIMTGGEGSFIEDRDGHRLLDGFAGLYCVNVGYGRDKIADAISAQARRMPPTPTVRRSRPSWRRNARASPSRRRRWRSSSLK